MAEQTITRWECPECGRADGGVAGGRPIRAVPHQRHDMLFAGDAGECPGMAVERHYVAVDALVGTPAAVLAAALIWISPVNGEDQITEHDMSDMRRALQRAADVVREAAATETGGKTDAI